MVKLPGYLEKYTLNESNVRLLGIGYSILNCLLERESQQQYLVNVALTN